MYTILYFSTNLIDNLLYKNIANRKRKDEVIQMHVSDSMHVMSDVHKNKSFVLKQG